MTVHVLAAAIDLHVPHAHSLKEKRAVVKTILEGARHRYQVAAAETDHQDKWQRAELAFVGVSSSAHHVEDVLDDVERFVRSFPEAEVLGVDRTWLETS